MNKYAFGYTLTVIVGIVGWLLIVGSLVLSVMIFKIAPSGSEYIAFPIFFVGLFQGVILLGVGSIGESILDGARLQRESLGVLISIEKSLKENLGGEEGGRVGATSKEGLFRSMAEANSQAKNLAMSEEFDDNLLSVESEDLPIQTSYFGYNIRKHPTGYAVGQMVFGSIIEAYQKIDSAKNRKAKGGV